MRHYSCLGLSIVIWLITFHVTGAWATIHTVHSSDPSIHYSNPAIDWEDQDNGGHMVSRTHTASAVFPFTGSSISWLSSHDWNGATATITVDGAEGVTVDQADGTIKDGPKVEPAVLFSKSGLDGTKEHTIQVSWAGEGSLGGGYLGIFGFVYDDDPGITAPTSSANAIQAGPGTTSPSISTTVSTTISSTTKTESSTTTTSVTVSNVSVKSKPGASSTGTFATSSTGTFATSSTGTFATATNGTATQSILITATHSVTVSQTESSGTVTLIGGNVSPSSSSVTQPDASGTPLNTTSNDKSSEGGRSNMGVIVGVVVGVVVALVLGALLLLCFIRRRRRNLATGRLKQMESEGNVLPGTSVQSLLPRDMTHQNLPPFPGAIPAARPHDGTSIDGHESPSTPLRGASKIAAAARARFLANSNASMSARPLSDIAPPTYTERP